MTAPSVLLVGRRRVFLDSLAMWLGEVPDLVLHGGPVEPGDLVAGRVPVVDVGLVDLRLPTSDLLAVARALRAANGSVGLVALSEAEPDHRATAVVTAGFTGWVCELDTCQDVVAAVLTVHAGRVRVPTELLVRAVHRMHGGRDRRPTVQDRQLASLTVRERQVLDLLAEGLDKEAIAARLFVSPHTVRTHQQHVLGKLRVHTTLAAVSVLRAARSGLEPRDSRTSANAAYPAPVGALH